MFYYLGNEYFAYWFIISTIEFGHVFQTPLSFNWQGARSHEVKVPTVKLYCKNRQDKN